MMRCMQALEEMKLNVSWFLALYGKILLSAKQERDDRKELIYVALARNLCRAIIEA